MVMSEIISPIMMIVTTRMIMNLKLGSKTMSIKTDSRMIDDTANDEIVFILSIAVLVILFLLITAEMLILKVF